jgi:hypothetical protein
MYDRTPFGPLLLGPCSMRDPKDSVSDPRLLSQSFVGSRRADFDYKHANRLSQSFHISDCCLPKLVNGQVTLR